MRFDVITLFPEMFEGPLTSSIVKRAKEHGHITITLHNLRDAATNKHKTVDDTPYGGGAGMVLKVDVLHQALQNVLDQPEVHDIPKEKRRVILLSAQGKRFRQPLARYAAENYTQITLICGHYEGFDDRIRKYIDTELSVGDFILTGGELPAMVVIDAITRLIPEVIAEESPHEESFSLKNEVGEHLLEYPHYTRPVDFHGEQVPDILLSGNHTEIAKWRLEQAKLRTQQQALSGDDTI